MTEDIDIWRAAKVLADGDTDGQRIWMRIGRAIEELLRGRGDDPLH